jgi:DNA-binding Xre family transcriptional regulator
LFDREDFLQKRTLSSLGVLVRGKRGKRRLRETAKEIAISAATLMRIEAGRIPDVETFGKICRWLEIDPGEFLGLEKTSTAAARTAEPPVRISPHFKADRLPLPATATALAQMLLFIAERQVNGTLDLGDADA